MPSLWGFRKATGKTCRAEPATPLAPCVCSVPFPSVHLTLLTPGFSIRPLRFSFPTPSKTTPAHAGVPAQAHAGRRHVMAHGAQSRPARYSHAQSPPSDTGGHCWGNWGGCGAPHLPEPPAAPRGAGSEVVGCVPWALCSGARCDGEGWEGDEEGWEGMRRERGRIGREWKGRGCPHAAPPEHPRRPSARQVGAGQRCWWAASAGARRGEAGAGKRRLPPLRWAPLGSEPGRASQLLRGAAGRCGHGGGRGAVTLRMRSVWCWSSMLALRKEVMITLPYLPGVCRSE